MSLLTTTSCETQKSGKKKRIMIIILAIIGVLALAECILLGWFGIGPFAAIGDLRMQRLPGNGEQYSFSAIKPRQNSPLEGQNIIALGSSVTYGSAALREGPGEYLAARYGCTLTKEAINSGTTLSTAKGQSYVERLQKIPKDTPCGLLLVQLSTNDASRNIPLGTISSGKDPAAMDTSTVTGAIEYILLYGETTWNCPVVFFTGSRYDSPAYEAMVERLYELREKYEFGILDLFTTDAFNNEPDDESLSIWMSDSIHPTKAGYRDWWGPELDRQLSAYLEKRPYSFHMIEPRQDSPLQGGSIAILGSSVAFGANSGEKAVGEYLAIRYGCSLTKETVIGTTLCTAKENSYVERLRGMDMAIRHDLFVVQLSTNDASQHCPLGEISPSMNIDDMDPSTVTGAMEYIILYVRQHWNCPVVFFTGSRYNNGLYEQMVTRLLELQQKYGIGVLDLWTDDDFNAISAEQNKLYMADPIHPTKAGYRDWWGPELDRQLFDYLTAR